MQKLKTNTDFFSLLIKSSNLRILGPQVPSTRDGCHDALSSEMYRIVLKAGQSTDHDDVSRYARITVPILPGPTISRCC